MKTITLNEQQIEFIKWTMEAVLDVGCGEYSNTSKAVAQGIINQLNEAE